MYSQRGEDEVILKEFPNLNDGRFLDIGAADGVTFSNTWALAQRGWQGVWVEPNPYHLSRLLDHRAALGKGLEHFQIVQAAVTKPLTEPHQQWGRMSITRELMSTLDQVHHDQWADQLASYGHPFEEVLVRCVSLEDLLLEVGLRFHVVSIDVEGLDLDILKQWPFGRSRPKIFVAEHNGKLLAQMDGFMKGQNYRKIWEGPENAIYRTT